MTATAHNHTTTWADNLTSALDAADMTQSELGAELKKLNVEVSHQAISAWCSGNYMPRPRHQAAIARVLRTPTHLLFPAVFDSGVAA